MQGVCVCVFGWVRAYLCVCFNLAQWFSDKKINQMPKYTIWPSTYVPAYLLHTICIFRISHIQNFNCAHGWHTKCQIKKIRESIYSISELQAAATAASATPVQLNFLLMVFVALYVANAWSAASITRTESEIKRMHRIWVQVVCSFVRFALLFALHWKYIFT